MHSVSACAAVGLRSDSRGAVALACTLDLADTPLANARRQGMPPEHNVAQEDVQCRTTLCPEHGPAVPHTPPSPRHSCAVALLKNAAAKMKNLAITQPTFRVAAVGASVHASDCGPTHGARHVPTFPCVRGSAGFCSVRKWRPAPLDEALGRCVTLSGSCSGAGGLC